ncbi:transcriptional coactivator p15/PC4 family protein [Xanthobacter flavus]|uniref:transcriptional coactivator p15/PC4 family protein n=1 Tax=Xanthobacter flavus TaxID=281 RepID=UPI003729440C
MKSPTSITVAEWPKNGKETLRVQLTEYQGRPIIDLRVWYEGRDGELRPSRSGLTCSTSHVERLADALAEALSQLKAARR